jgi:hypothetical protein
MWIAPVSSWQNLRTGWKSKVAGCVRRTKMSGGQWSRNASSRSMSIRASLISTMTKTVGDWRRSSNAA